MHATTSALLRRTGLLAGVVLALNGAWAAQPDKQTDAFPNFESYIKFSGYAPSISGQDSAFQKRTNLNASGGVGIEDLHLLKNLDKDVTLTADGKALTGSEDYLFKLNLTKDALGKVDVGYKRFRTFYNGVGGFFPTNGLWLPLNDTDLHTDRGNFWADVVIAKENSPVFHFRYTNELRSGQKDTTIWNDSSQTGIPIYSLSSLNPVSAVRKLGAAYIDLGERQQTMSAAVTHTIGKTEVEVEIVNNKTDSLDTRWLNRYQGELKPYPAIPSSPVTVIPGNLANNPVSGYDKQGIDADVWTYVAKFETEVSDLLKVFGGVSYQDANVDIYGDRQLSLKIQTATGIVNAVGGFTSGGRPPYSYTTQAGLTEETVLTANFGAVYKPIKNLSITAALKGEDLEMKGYNQVTYVNTLINQATGATSIILVPAPNTSTRDETSWTPEVDVRYTGIKDLSLYLAFDYRYAPATETGVSTGVTPSGSNILPSVVTFAENVKENHGHWKAGANWNVSSSLILRGELFYKDHTNGSNGFGASLGNQFILGYKFEGTKLTAIYKPTATVAFTTRYINQRGKMDTTIDATGAYDSMDSKSHMFGETVEWTPNEQMYVQANLNVVFDTLSTSYPQAGILANDTVHNADNNYWNGNVLTGFVLSKDIDAQLEYSCYHADNFDPALAASTLPLGTAIDEYTVTAGLKFKLSERLIGTAKVGYIDSKSDDTGGKTNFRGPVGYVSLTYAL